MEPPSRLAPADSRGASPPALPCGGWSSVSRAGGRTPAGVVVGDRPWPARVARPGALRRETGGSVRESVRTCGRRGAGLFRPGVSTILFPAASLPWSVSARADSERRGWFRRARTGVLLCRSARRGSGSRSAAAHTAANRWAIGPAPSDDRVRRPRRRRRLQTAAPTASPPHRPRTVGGLIGQVGRAA